MTRRVPLRLSLAFLVARSPLASQPASWSRVRYLGGTLGAKVNPYDWNTKLSIENAQLELVFAGRDRRRIPTAAITNLAFGQKAFRRVSDMVALSFVVTPLALFGILHQAKEHTLSVEFRDESGKPQALLLELDKSNYRAIVLAVAAATGKKVDNAPP